MINLKNQVVNRFISATKKDQKKQPQVKAKAERRLRFFDDVLEQAKEDGIGL